MRAVEDDTVSNIEKKEAEVTEIKLPVSLGKSSRPFCLVPSALHAF